MTYQKYKDIGQGKKFEDKPDFIRYKKELKWYDAVKSKRTGDFYQADDLIRRELVPGDWKPPHVDAQGKPLPYPVKYVNSIIRVRTPDSREWVKTRQQWYGLDVAGNPINISMDDKEMYDNVLPIRRHKEEKPGNKDTKMVSEIVNLESRFEYTEPFSPETIQRLYDMRNGKCTLVLKDETSDTPPYSFTSLEDFKNRPFQDLLDYASTPKHKAEPATTEEHKQYA